MKLECLINKAIFVASKLYIIETNTNETKLIIKGLNKDTCSILTYNDIEFFLKYYAHIKQVPYKRSIYVDIKKLELLNNIYTFYSIHPQGFKRKKIYINKRWVSTLPH